VAELQGDLSVAPVELWAPGSAVVALGAGDEGEDVLAVWQVSPQGAPSGAWTISQEEVFTSPEPAQRFLTLIERRAITATRGDVADEVVQRLSAASAIGSNGRWGEQQAFSPVQAFRDVLARREAITAAVNQAKNERKNVAALEWARDLSDSPAPHDVEDLRRLAGLAPGPGTPACAEAITVARTLRWLVKLWAETEQVKNRRGYVRDALGDPEALPPSWLAAVHTASATVLPL
jgi:Family of unknown function (DUF6218)